MYALPRSRRGVWMDVLPVILAAFRVQLYFENNSPQQGQLSIWGDFSDSTRPHIAEFDAAVAAALAVAVW